MSNQIRRSLFFIFIITSVTLFSQSKIQLQQEKEKLENDIKETNNKLNKEKKKKNSALSQLKLSNRKINQHKKLLLNLEKTINFKNARLKRIKKSIEETELEITQKETEIVFSKEVYSKLIYQTHIWKNTYNESYFLISSSNLNQLYKRKQYLKQLTIHRSNQIKKIKRIKSELIEKNEELVKKKNDLISEKQKQEELYIEQTNQTKKLETEKEQKEKIVSNIKDNEQFYRNQLNQKRKHAQEIEDQIKKIIEEEIRRAREEAEINNTGTPLTPEALELSSKFELNKGKLPWPLTKAKITERYGVHENKHISGVETKNNGINLETDEGQLVRAVFDGSVSRIFYIKGKGKAVLISHGGYFTVYSGLKDVVVKTGEKVISKQKIGTVLTLDSSMGTELHFEIWKGKYPQNPVKWLYKAK
tara:strand:- start:1031 stop:2284 length:1254 start_codon:yes stop_codon:yes gene_type:complete